MTGRRAGPCAHPDVADPAYGARGQGRGRRRRGGRFGRGRGWRGDVDPTGQTAEGATEARCAALEAQVAALSQRLDELAEG